MIRVLVVEDDPIAAAAHASYVERVPGFTVAGCAATGAEAIRRLAQGSVDLVLLDMNLPDVHGLDVCRAMRAAGDRADVIAVTSARELAVVRAAVSTGIVQYVLKPFAFPTLRDRLERYADYRAEMLGRTTVTGQQEIDRLLTTLRAQEDRLPKGMSPDLLESAIAALRDDGGPVSATELAGQLGVSRVTARRYLEYLTDSRLTTRSSRHGGTGRPELEYRWRGG